MHVFVPALPLIAREFDVTPAAAQQTISVYMLALAGGQIVYGPLSDWYGRRAGADCRAPALHRRRAHRRIRLEPRHATRGAHGAGRGRLRRLRARPRDRQRHVGNADAAATISALNSILLISPALAPLLGVWIADAYGWRPIPLLLGAIGSVALIGVVVRLSETSPPAAQTIGELAAGYGRLLHSLPFLGYVIGGALTTTTMFALLATSPFILVERLHRPLHEVGYVYAVLIAGVMIGNAFGGRLLRRFSFETLMIAACVSGAAGAALIWLSNLQGGLTAPAFVAGGLLYTGMCGLMAPLSLTRSIELAPALAGTASGLYGFSQMSIGALAVAIAGYGADVVGATSTTLLICSCAGLAIFVALKVWRETRVRA